MANCYEWTLPLVSYYIAPLLFLYLIVAAYGTLPYCRRRRRRYCYRRRYCRRYRYSYRRRYYRYRCRSRSTFAVYVAYTYLPYRRSRPILPSLAAYLTIARDIPRCRSRIVRARGS